ncbi:hypothetical protein [Marinitoga aeolica]|uniref:Dockerin domain-containing protein n=1 Tax=Marinitoga aeolica TaxID=2809031 RepID=A0ABY8PPF4_9BACT|nr:hypothetical protein [Marinitoga aeolica]WGS64500.1 hypothetical protein JRV97_08985 [Marinitoga aeolica]
MKNKKIFLILIIIVLTLSSCFNFKKIDAIENNRGSITIEKINDEYIIKSNTKADSFEFTIKNIDKENIYIPPDFLKIIKNNDGLKIAISSPKLINPGTVLMKIKSKKPDIKHVEIYNRYVVSKNFDEDTMYDKGISFGLLGDFNFDGKVSISDFSSFTTFYGQERKDFYGNMKDFDLADIGPAENFAHKGIWNNVFDLAKPDGRISLADFSIFAANYDIDIFSPQSTIVVNSNTDPSTIADETEMNVVTGLIKIYNIYSEILNFISQNGDLINLLATENPSPTSLLKYVVNISDATETAVLNIIEDINDFSNLVGVVKDGYLYEDIKYEINNFDWDLDGNIENTSPLKFKVITHDGSDISIPFYDIFTLDGPPKSIEIDQTGGDAIFDYDMFLGNIDENYIPEFNDNDYLLVDEGTAAGMSVFSKILGIIGKALFIYDLSDPSINIKNAINNNEDLTQYIPELLLTLLQNPPPSDSQKILGSELQASIFGNMLKFKDFTKSIELINHIKNDLSSFHDLIKMLFEDKVMDYIVQPHDPTSGEKPPILKNDFEMSMNLLHETEKMANLINNPAEGVDIPLGYNEYFTLHPGVFFNNPEDFSDLNIFLPDISIISTFDSTNLLIELPDPTFKGLIEGLPATLTINLEEFGKKEYFIHQEDITVIGTSVTFKWYPSPDLNATITYEIIVDRNEDNVWNYIEGNIPSQDLLIFAKTSNTQITLQLDEGDYFWAVIGYADFGNGKIEKIYPENPYWFSVFLKNIYYYIDLINPLDETDFSETPTDITFSWQAFNSENGEDNPIDVDYYIFHLEKLDGTGIYIESEETINSTTIEIIEDGKYGWWVDGYYTDPETFETIEIHSNYYTFKAGNVVENAYFYPIEPYDFIPVSPGTTSIEIYFAWGTNNLQTERISNIFELYYKDEESDTWQSTTNTNIYWHDDYGNYEAEAFISGFVPNKSYEWKIRAYINDSDYIESPIWYFSIEEEIWLLNLHSIHPMDGEATTNNVKFTWGYDPDYTGNFELHVRPTNTWEETYDTLITPTDYSTDTDPITGEMTFNYTLTLPDGIYKWWVAIPQENTDNYEETEHRWLFVNETPFDILLDYPEPMAVFDYYTISFGWHKNWYYLNDTNITDLTFEVIDDENNIVYTEDYKNSDDWTTVTFNNPGVYFWRVKDNSGNIISDTFNFEIKDWWNPPEENEIGLYTPLNGEIILSNATYTNIDFSWSNVENIDGYSFNFIPANMFLDSVRGHIDEIDYTPNNFYSLELKNGIYLWNIRTYDYLNDVEYQSPIRSFNILNNQNIELDVIGPTNKERATPLDTISFVATSLSNSEITYYILIMNSWGEIYVIPNSFENDLIHPSGSPVELGMWELFNNKQFGDLYYYAIIANDGENMIISPVQSFYYDDTLYGNFVSFDKEQINLSQDSTFTIRTQGPDISNVNGLEIHLRIDPEIISIDSSSIILNSENSFIKSFMRHDDWNNEDYLEVIISLYSNNNLDLSNTDIAKFTISSTYTNIFTNINIIDAYVTFEENIAPVKLEVGNILNVTSE